MNSLPNPGSDEAYEQGCKCARMDNGYGKGYFGIGGGEGVFCISGDCPLHSSEIPVTVTDVAQYAASLRLTEAEDEFLRECKRASYNSRNQEYLG